MEINFEEVISGFLENRVGVSNTFLSTDLAFNLKQNLINLYDQKALQLAGTGNIKLSIDETVRKDKIFWLDRKNELGYEDEFFDLIDAFVLYLNRTCFSNIKSYEFHYALYEKGAFYKKHIDQFKSDDSRLFSMIMYLNKGWIKDDGGELKVYTETEIQLISPESQKCVFFKSNELPHEVLLTNVSRMSVTGWLKTSL